jgi:hypothetical protein
VAVRGRDKLLISDGMRQTPVFLNSHLRNSPLNYNRLQMSSAAYESLVARLREQMQTLPAPPAEVGDYEIWARRFVVGLVSDLLDDMVLTDIR